MLRAATRKVSATSLMLTYRAQPGDGGCYVFDSVNRNDVWVTQLFGKCQPLSPEAMGPCVSHPSSFPPSSMSSIVDPKDLGVKRHEDLYFKDGNIVLVAEGTCFRVHAGQLTRHSDVFRGMMSIPQPSNAQKIDECPVVALHDTAAEVTHLLKALYDGLYFTEGTAVDFPVLSAVLRLSTKYFFDCLRQRALVRLRADWPHTLPDWDAREKLATTSDGLYNPSTIRTNPILVVNLARELYLPSVLPAAFYDLSRYTPSQILGGSPNLPGSPKAFLNGADLMKLFRGKEAGQRFVSAFISKELEDRAVTSWCRNVHENSDSICRDTFVMVMYETLRGVAGLTTGRDNDPLFTLQCAVEMLTRKTGSDVAEKVTTRGCEMCRADLRTSIETARRVAWECMPQWFGLDARAEEYA